ASRTRRLLFLLLLLVMAGAGVTLLVEWDALHHRKSVLTTLRIEGLDPIVAAVIEEGQEEVRKDSQSAAAWGKLGQMLFVHGLDGPAAEAFGRASELAPNDVRWQYLRGRALKRENGDAALPFLRRAAELCRGEPAAPGLML